MRDARGFAARGPMLAARESGIRNRESDLRQRAAGSEQRGTSVMPTALLLVVLLPALGALVNGLRAFAQPLTPKNKTITNFFALASTFLSALIATWVVWGSRHAPWEHSYYSWIPAGIGRVREMIASFNIDFAFRIDPLSST